MRSITTFRVGQSQSVSELLLSRKGIRRYRSGIPGLLLALMMLSPLPAGSGNRYKVISYYSTTAYANSGIRDITMGTATYSAFPIDSVSLSKIDILILFANHSNGAATTSAPYLTYVGGQVDSLELFHGNGGGQPGIMATTIRKVHDAGKKILISLEVQSDATFASVLADSTLCDRFATAAARFARRNGFDGIDMNRESAIPPANMGRYLRLQRKRLNEVYGAAEPGRAIFTVVPGPNLIDNYPASEDSSVTYFMVQYYGDKTAWDGRYGRGSAWPGNAYSSNFPANFQGSNFLERGFNSDGNPQDLIAAGWSARKIVMGIFSLGYVFIDCDSIGGAYGAGTPAETAMWWIRDSLYNHGFKDVNNHYTKQREISGRRPWNQAPIGWAGPGDNSGDPFYATIPNDSTAKYMSKFCDSLGLGGIMTWVLDREIDRTKPRNGGRTFTTERVQHWLTMYGDGGVAQPSGFLTVTPAQLPSGGGSVQLQWGSSDASSAVITPSVGSVGLSGTTSVNVAATTTFTLTVTGPGGTASYQATVTLQSGTSRSLVYDDSLYAPFTNQSWGAVVSFTSAQPVCNGQRAIRADMSAWGGVQIQNGPSGGTASFDYVQYDSLSCDLFSGRSIPVMVGFDGSGSQLRSSSPGRWTRISVPIPKVPFTSFSLQNYQADTALVHIDNIRFLVSASKTGSDPEVGPPKDFSLHQNYPNPFNPVTTITFQLSKGGRVSLRVFNMLGQELETLAAGDFQAGTHSVNWDARGRASGVYFYRLMSEGNVETMRMVLQK